MAQNFHDKSKEASNKLKGYILSIASFATGVFFFSLTGKDVSSFSIVERALLFCAMLFFALTVILSLFELKIDSNRFFLIAKEKEKDESEQQWDKIKNLKKLRLRLLNTTYLTLTVGFVLTFIYMISRLL